MTALTGGAGSLKGGNRKVKTLLPSMRSLKHGNYSMSNFDDETEKENFHNFTNPRSAVNMDIGTVLNTHVNNILKDVALGSIIVKEQIFEKKLQKPR